MKGWGGVEGGISVATLEQSMPHAVLSKTWSPNHCVQRAKIFSSMWSAGSGDMWICTPISSKKQFQRWSACFEKKSGKKLVNMPQRNPNPTRSVKFAKFARENLAQFGLQICLFRCGENVSFRKTLFLQARFPVRMFLPVYIWMVIISNDFHMWVGWNHQPLNRDDKTTGERRRLRYSGWY